MAWVQTGWVQSGWVQGDTGTTNWQGKTSVPGSGTIYDPLRVPLERPNYQAQLHRSEIARGVHALGRSLPLVANLPLTKNTTAGTAWTSLSGLPAMIGWENIRQLEVVGELQWQHTAAALPDGNEQPFEMRVLIDRSPIHAAEIQLQQVRQTLPAPATLAAGSLFFLAPLQRLPPGPHQLDVQVRAYTGATWVVLSTSAIRYATY